MNYENYFKDLLESIPDYSKNMLLLFLLQNIKNLLLVIGFSESSINRLNLEFKNILTEQFEEFLHFVKNEADSIIESFLN